MFPTAHGVVSQVVARQPSGGGGGGVLGLVVADAEHATTTTAKGELEGLGYTVTVIEEGNVGTTDWSPFAALVTCRVSGTTQVGNAIRVVMDSGKPAVLGAVPANPPLNDNVSTIVRRVGFTGSNWRVRSAQAVWLDVKDATHPITSPYSAGQVNVLAGTGYRCGGTCAGDVLGISSVFTGGEEPGLIALEVGTDDLVARAVVIDYIGSGQALTANGLTILDRSLRWAVGEL